MPAILTASEQRGHRPLLTKVFTDQGVTEFSKVYLYDIEPFDFVDFDDMVAVLSALEHEPYVAIVRGDPITTGPKQRRLLHDKPNGDKPTLRARDGGLPWVMIDLDKVPAPADLTTADERLLFLRSTLPAPFQDARCFFQWSSSAGTKGWDLLSAHLWFWLDKPIECQNLKERTTEKNGDFYNHLDGAPFSPGQLHYIAAPYFLDYDDPLGTARSGVLPGAHDTVALERWIKPYQPRSVYRTAAIREHHKPGAGFEERLHEIGMPHFHEPIRAAIAHYVAVNRVETRDREYCLDRIREAAATAPRSYITEEYLSRLYDGAEQRFG